MKENGECSCDAACLFLWATRVAREGEKRKRGCCTANLVSPVVQAIELLLWIVCMGGGGGGGGVAKRIRASNIHSR